MAKHTDKWSRWAREGDRVKEHMQRETQSRSENFGPDATVKHKAPPVTCPRCGATIEADAVARHGSLHRALDASFIR